MLSPFKRIFPNGFLVFFLTLTSSASSEKKKKEKMYQQPKPKFFLLFFFCLYSSFNVSFAEETTSTTTSSVGKNPFTVKDSLNRYWKDQISNNLPKPSFLISKASPLTAVDAAFFAKLADQNALSTKLSSFCSSANLYCFTELTPSSETDANLDADGQRHYQGQGHYAQRHYDVPNVDADGQRHYHGQGHYAQRHYDVANVDADGQSKYHGQTRYGQKHYDVPNVNADGQTHYSGQRHYGQKHYDVANFDADGQQHYEHQKHYGQRHYDVANVNADGQTHYHGQRNYGQKHYDVANLDADGQTHYRGQRRYGQRHYDVADADGQTHYQGQRHYGQKHYDVADTDGQTHYQGQRHYGQKHYDVANVDADGQTHYHGQRHYGQKHYGVVDGKPVNRWVEPGIFFRESNLKQGTLMTMPDIRDKMPKRSFLPRTISSKLPFTSSKLTQLNEIFHASENSGMENILKSTIEDCEIAPNHGESRRCVGSIEDMMDFATSLLGHNVVVRSMEGVEGSGKEVMVGVVKGINGGKITKSVSCHQSMYPYMVYYCHSVPKVRVYEVEVLDAKTKLKINKGVVVCHVDTSTWSPEHEAFAAVGSSPGKTEVCHWIYEGAMNWAMAD